MPTLRTILVTLGTVMALVGALWIGQGFGYINWPETSPMLGRRPWVNYGTALAVAGLLLVLVGRRAPGR